MPASRATRSNCRALDAQRIDPAALVIEGVSWSATRGVMSQLAVWLRLATAARVDRLDRAVAAIGAASARSAEKSLQCFGLHLRILCEQQRHRASDVRGGERRAGRKIKCPSGVSVRISLPGAISTPGFAA